MSGRYRKNRGTGKKIGILIVVLISLFCIIFFSARGRFRAPILNQAVSVVVTPFQSAISWVGSQLNYVTSNIWEIATVHQQNKMLRNEVEQLRIQNLHASEYDAENQRLRALLGYKQSATQFNLVAARVIGRESATWSSVIEINRGTRDGVDVDMAVVTEKGLVGHVIEAGPTSSKVELILDPRSSVGTLVQRADSRVAGIVEGDMDNPTMPRMVNIPKTADVDEGDVIVTSGFGGVYPKGLMVGTVSEMRNDEGGLLKIAILEPAVDFQRLEDVMVITASREAPPAPLKTPPQTPGTETDPAAQAAAAAAAAEESDAGSPSAPEASSADSSTAAGEGSAQ
ncbi:rod shape-determining protein MreC [Mitsuokella sp.]|uniref:rod shape-determining protein MreC n=1 Tax=Mitsuokella TaxID=52225 RepID=UPI0029E23CFB|nr:rod shape-determining protein MreC [Mitsuokella sp.]MDD6382698.1 rod shape-determining protein MreC [Selenomonadaceae bacterium]MDY4474487.1 rod shape-determining protein MreC [Mitsuokella sp.]